MQNDPSLDFIAQILHILPAYWIIVASLLVWNQRKGRPARIFCFAFSLLQAYHHGRALNEGSRVLSHCVLAASINRRKDIFPFEVLGVSSGIPERHRSPVAFLHPVRPKYEVITAYAVQVGPNDNGEKQASQNIARSQIKSAGEDEVDTKGAITAERVINPRSGSRKIRKGMFPGPLTVADIIRYRMIAQPPPASYTRRVLARKPWKRMEIPARIKQEKQRIEETDSYLDQYFYEYLTSRGPDSGLSSGLKGIDLSLFKPPTGGTGNESQQVPSCITAANLYNVDELLQVWNTRGGYFYTNIPKTVAVLQIIRRIAEESEADQDVRKVIREHECFKRIVGSVVRHMKYVSRIVLPKHLKNYDKLLKMLPMFNAQQMTTIFSIFAYFGFRKEKVIEAMINHCKPFKKFNPEDMRSIIMSCLAMKVDPTSVVQEYIEQLKEKMKEGKELSPMNGNLIDYYLDVLHICNKTDQMDNWLFSHIADFVKQQTELKIEDAVEALCIFTHVQHLDEVLFQNLYGMMLRNIAYISGKSMVQKLIMALSVSHFKPPKELVDHLSAMLLKEIKLYSLVELTSALRALSLMDNYNEELYRKLLSLQIFAKPPSVKVLQQINLQLNKKRGIYSAYLQPVSSSELNVVFGNLYQAYLGYNILSKNQNKIKLPKEAEERLKDIYSSGVRNWTFSSSSLHLQVRDLLKEAFDIDCAVEHVTTEGLVLDLAILPSSLQKQTEKIGAKDFLKDKKCAIEVHGPFHYLQKSTEQFPPPLDSPTLFKERLLREGGWDVSHLHYWTFVPWMKREHKIRVLHRLLPSWVKKLCPAVENDKVASQSSLKATNQ